MHAVINDLLFKAPIDDALFERVEAEVGPQMRAIEGFHSFHIVKVADDHLVLLVFGADAAALDRIATDVGNSWMGANVAPLLAQPPGRRLGPILASVDV